MNNRLTIEVDRELLKQTTVDDEYLFRELARKMVTDMPINELKKLIRFNITNPFSDESEDIIRNPRQPRWKRNQLMFLQQKNVLLYEAECDLP